LIEEYNAGHHRTIKQDPIEVNKSKEGEAIITENQEYSEHSTGHCNQIKNGDPGQKGYLIRVISLIGQKKLFKIGKVLEITPATYQIEDMSGERDEDCFYNEELLKTKLPRIEKVLRKKIVDCKVSLRVKWKDYDNKFW